MINQKSLAILLLILSTILTSGSIAQTAEGETYVLDLGKIKKKNEDVVDLAIHNPESEAIFLLNYQCEYPMRFLASQPFIEADGTEVYRIKVNPKEKGEFDQVLQLYFSHSKTPYFIRLKGEVIEVPTNDLQKCPSFKDLPSSRQLARNQRRSRGNIQEFSISLDDSEATSEPQLADEAEILRPDTVLSATEEVEEIPTLVPEDDGLLGDEYRPNNIIFLIDASSSMEEEERFDLLKISLIELLKPLRSIDYLSMISYSGEAELLLAPTSSVEKDQIEKRIRKLKAGGSTNAVKGIDLAIATAYESFIEDGNNEIYLVTDGAFKLGRYNRRSRSAIQKAAADGIYISALAVKSQRESRKSLKEIVELGEGDLIRLERMADKDIILRAIKESSLR